MYSQRFYIKNLALQNQLLISKCVDLGRFDIIKDLKKIEQELSWALKRSSKSFDFISAVAKGKTLFVGEGNLSFALSIAKKLQVSSQNMIATVFESKRVISDITRDNAEELERLGINVIFSVDATKLSGIFGIRRFDNIIFQFPNVGSREPIRGRNPNFVLIRDFLKSSAGQLNHNGKVIISAVDNPHYNGAFGFDEAAEYAGFATPEVYPFDPNDFSGYVHTMTLEDESAIEDHNKFSTWVFDLE